MNSIARAEAQAKTGPLPEAIEWHDAMRDLPDFLRGLFRADMAQGVGWKLAPLRMFPDRWEIALDNDCILWDAPPSMRAWLAHDGEPAQCLLAQDVRACYGQFAGQCPCGERNTGIRGVPPGFDLETALREVIEQRQRQVLTSELDEQGLQTAALSLGPPMRVVTLDEVSVCSPFHPHLPEPGRCGAHFVGLNARHIAWDYYDRPADAWMAEHWRRHRAQLYRRTGAP